MIARYLSVAAILWVAAPAHVDLARIGHVQSKGRVQDKDYNDLPMVDRLISMGPSAISFLVSKLEDEDRVEGHVFDFWPDVHVGDIALVVLCDLFLKADGRSPTVPGMEWEALLERRSQDVPSHVLLESFIATRGRSEIRHRVEKLLQAYPRGFAWDEKERCFKPSK